MSGKPARDPWLKPAVFLAALSPLVWLGSRALRGTLGPDPVAEVLNRKRPLSLEMIRRLHTGLGIGAEILIQSYPLAIPAPNKGVS